MCSEGYRGARASDELASILSQLASMLSQLSQIRADCDELARILGTLMKVSVLRLKRGVLGAEDVVCVN